MCTLILFFRAIDGVPLLVGASRDEKLTRPSAPPSVAVHHGTRLVCPRDLRGGGTWLGVNEHGLFVGITNRFGAPPEPERRSRGLIVLDALALPGARAARDYGASLDARRENPFHLVVADREEASLLVHDGSAITTSAIAPGLFIATERSFGPAIPGREAWLRAHLAGSWMPAPSLEALGSLLGTHGEDPLNVPCVHIPGVDYGTRSSTLIRFGDAQADVEMRFADGPPCQTPYLEVALESLRFG